MESCNYHEKQIYSSIRVHRSKLWMQIEYGISDHISIYILLLLLYIYCSNLKVWLPYFTSIDGKYVFFLLISTEPDQLLESQIWFYSGFRPVSTVCTRVWRMRQRRYMEVPPELYSYMCKYYFETKSYANSIIRTNGNRYPLISGRKAIQCPTCTLNNSLCHIHTLCVCEFSVWERNKKTISVCDRQCHCSVCRFCHIFRHHPIYWLPLYLASWIIICDRICNYIFRVAHLSHSNMYLFCFFFLFLFSCIFCKYKKHFSMRSFSQNLYIILFYFYCSSIGKFFHQNKCKVLRLKRRRFSCHFLTWIASAFLVGSAAFVATMCVICHIAYVCVFFFLARQLWLMPCATAYQVIG